MTRVFSQDIIRVNEIIRLLVLGARLIIIIKYWEYIKMHTPEQERIIQDQFIEKNYIVSAFISKVEN